MWSYRLFTGTLVAAICAGTCLSAGSGSAAALPPATEEIAAVAEEVALPVAEKLGLGAFVRKIESLFESQATRLTPATDEVELSSIKTEWLGFEPRAPSPGEVAPVGGVLPFVYRQAGELLSGTAMDLLNNPDEPSWKSLIEQVDKQVDKQIVAQFPLGKELVIYSELNDINEKSQCHQYCAATAELQVFFAKMRYCEEG